MPRILWLTSASAIVIAWSLPLSAAHRVDCSDREVKPGDVLVHHRGDPYKDCSDWDCKITEVRSASSFTIEGCTWLKVVGLVGREVEPDLYKLEKSCLQVEAYGNFKLGDSVLWKKRKGKILRIDSSGVAKIKWDLFSKQWNPWTLNKVFAIPLSEAKLVKK